MLDNLQGEARQSDIREQERVTQDKTEAPEEVGWGGVRMTVRILRVLGI